MTALYLGMLLSKFCQSDGNTDAVAVVKVRFTGGQTRK